MAVELRDYLIVAAALHSEKRIATELAPIVPDWVINPGRAPDTIFREIQKIEQEFKEVLFEKGKQSGYRIITESSLPEVEKIQKLIALNSLMSDGAIVHSEPARLSEVTVSSNSLPLYTTGTILDQLFGGVYPGIFTFMGPPGSGKTSLLISLAGKLAKKFPILIFQNEIPRDLYFARALVGIPEDVRKNVVVSFEDPTAEKVKHFGSKYFDGTTPLVIYDNPDASSAVLTRKDRADLAYANLYRELVRVKQHALAVLTTSQPRRKDIASMRIDSIAESWQKVWYTDALISLSPSRGASPSQVLLRLQVLKNRFGVMNSLICSFDYATLVLDSSISDDGDW